MTIVMMIYRYASRCYERWKAISTQLSLWLTNLTGTFDKAPCSHYLRHATNSGEGQRQRHHWPAEHEQHAWQHCLLEDTRNGGGGGAGGRSGAVVGVKVEGSSCMSITLGNTACW